MLKSKKIYEYLSIFVIYGIVYNTKNNSEKELYFIQQLTEFVNNEDLNKDVIRIIHNLFDNINSRSCHVDYTTFSLFIQKLNINTITLNKYVDIITLFFKKLNVNVINKHNLIQMNLTIEKIENYPTDKLITLLFTN